MAPDHQKIKRVADDLMAIQLNQSCKYFGGVTIGTDIKVNELESLYSGIFFAYGAQSDKLLGIPGEELQNVYNSRQIVNWYNSHPQYTNLNVPLDQVNTLAIIGNGNVSIDIARVLGQNLDNLSTTDINPNTMDAKSKSSIRNIVIIGRRGAVQSQFALKELREFKKLPEFRCLLYKPDLIQSLNEASIVESTDIGKHYGNTTRANRRKLEFLREFEIIEDEITLQSILNDKKSNRINVIFRYLLTPLRIEQENRLKLVLQNNGLIGDPFNQGTISMNTQIELECDMIVKAVGYQSQNQLRWNEQQHILDHSDGCLKLDESKLDMGKYCCGWIKSGPKGVIDTTFATSLESIVNLKNHLSADLLPYRNDPYDIVVSMLKQRNIGYLDFQGWQNINAHELKQGINQNRIRSKLSSIDEIKQYCK